MFKKMMFVLLGLALVGAVALAGAWAYGQAGQPALAQDSKAADDYDASRIITVLGEGSTRVQPDIAQITVGVETTGPTVSEAVKENNAKMQTIMAALEDAGIPAKDIQTSNYSISVDSTPQPLEGASGQSKPQYRVSNMVTVIIRDLTKVGGVLDAAVEAGANSMWGVGFSLDDTTAAQSAARAKAVADAQASAQELARLAGVKLGPVMSISEVMGIGVTPVPTRMEVAMDSGGAEVSPGEVEVSYQVQMSFYIEP
jgi:hypothetical protein